MTVNKVECHSGYAYAEHPIAFTWDGRRYEVATIRAGWHSPRGKHFRVVDKAGEVFELEYNEYLDRWRISHA